MNVHDVKMLDENGFLSRVIASKKNAPCTSARSEHSLN